MLKADWAAVAVFAFANSVLTAQAQTSRLSKWAPCPQFADLSCAYFDVPLDYHNTSAGNGQLLVVKAPATGERKGTIFLNPGGPGVSGLTSLSTDAEALMNRTGGAYDFVSWDPRGVGPYTYPGNVYCIPDDEYASFWNGTIESTGIHQIGNFTNQTDIQALYSQAPVLDQKWKELGDRCLSGPNATTLGYIGTAATVRDLVGLADAIVGPNSPINYWGLSYGTLVGAWFINMFPNRVGHVILDGVLDATRVATTQSYKLWRDQIGSAEDAYTAFTNACALAGPDNCKLATSANGTGQDVVDYVNQAIMLAHDHPVANQLLILRATMYSSLYQPQQWADYGNDYLPQTIATIQNATAGGNTTALTRREQVFTQNSYTEPAVVCADSVDADPSVNTTVIFDDIVDIVRTVSPSFGAVGPVPWQRCSYWPVRAPERYQGPFNRTLANKVLLIGNAYDNATPFAEAAHLAAVLGDQAALVKQNGFGHTSIYQSSACVTDIITAYLNDGTLPSGTSSDPTVCAIDSSVELFSGVESVDVIVNGTDLSRRD
ncbi:alpha/beta-hydrolase [Dichomitus squalens]|uniref:Alpha/beta-hydrolase n=1 Tax=Dichomitus squalens TaxID=114155 RepID=A0A4Q9Q4P2_9APHY|nr:alpha/beta-hydrolase [Dichomitus squalens]